jgi:D-alanine-D-alanine ligase
VSQAASNLARQAEDLSPNARGVAAILRAFGYAPRCFDFGPNAIGLALALQRFRPDAVYNLAESPLACYAKEPHATALLELLGLPYTGNGPTSLALCQNKATTKQILQAAGLPTPRFCVCNAVPRAALPLSYPLVVKPLRQDGSVGLTEHSVVHNHPRLRRAVGYILQTFAQEALVEEFVGGREFNVSVLGNGTRRDPWRVLPPGELVYHTDRWRICTFDAKWDEAHPSYAAVEAVCPASISNGLRRRLERIVLECARLFELHGYSRIDLRMDAHDRPHVLDINPNPDIAPHMGIARSAESAGLAYPEFVHRILKLGLALGQR